MALFKKKVKDGVQLATAPVEEETPGEIKHIEQLSEGEATKGITTRPQESEEKFREVPVCLSQTQINNVILENNFMLKRLMQELN